MRMNLLAATAIALAALTGGAFAQTTGTTGTANASNTVNVLAETGSGNGTDGSGTGSNGTGTTSSVKYSGHEYSTPSVQGSYFAGANPCLIGVGASGAGGPIGLSFTFGTNDKGCQRRSDAAAWHALGHDDVAISRMCQDDENRRAFEAIGYTCPQDRVKPVAAAAPATSAMVLASAAPMPVAPPAPAAKPRFVQPDWCSSVTGPAERAHYQQTCQF